MCIIAIDPVSGVSAKVKPRRPRWEDMIKFYPNSLVKTIDLYKTIGGEFPSYKDDEQMYKEKYLVNSCAVRMSRGLNLSGLKLPKDNSKYRAIGSKGGVMKSKEQDYYWLRVAELAKYLKDIWGEPDIVFKLKKAKVGESKEGLTAADWAKLRSKKGVIVFKVSGWGDATGHFTLWNGTNLIYPGNPAHDNPNSEYYYFNMKYEQLSKQGELKVIQTDQIELWELK